MVVVDSLGINKGQVNQCIHRSINPLRVGSKLILIGGGLSDD